MTKTSHASGVAIAVLLSIGLAGCGNDSPISGFTGGGQNVELKPTDMVHGAASAPVTIIEYASMTCPHCAAFAKDVMPKLVKDYVDTGKVKVVFREYPLDGAARMASAVARCLSGDQYFSFIDMLFANQMNWIKDFDNNSQITKEDIVEGLTQQGRVAGLSREKVQECADNPQNLALVDANWTEGQTKYMVNSTPTFIINGNTHTGELAYEALQKVIDPLVK